MESIVIHNTKVYVHGEEIKGLKRFMYLAITYTALPFVLLTVFAIVGVVLGLSMLWCIPLMAIAVIAFPITKLIKAYKQR